MLFPERGPSFIFALHTLVATLLRADASLAARHVMLAMRDSLRATFTTAVRAADLVAVGVQRRVARVLRAKQAFSGAVLTC